MNPFSFHCIHLVAVICIPENEVEVNPTFDCCSNWLYRDVYDVRRLYMYNVVHLRSVAANWKTLLYIAVLMHIRIYVNALRNAFLKKSPIKRLFKECPPPEGLLHFTIRGLIEMH